jgi:ATP-binding cassette subfamily C protein
LAEGARAALPAFSAVIVFSFFINLLLFVSPLYMLQIYDRVLTSRNETTLIGLTILAGLLLAVYARLEMLRSRILVRAGVLFDAKLADPLFHAIHRGNLKQPNGGFVQGLRDLDVLREFLTGSGLIGLCDAPWFPIFVGAAFLLHPWFGVIALVGSIITLLLTLLNELVTKNALSAASRDSMRAGQSAQAMFRNTEVLQAMGMVDALRKKWADQHGSVLAWQAQASDRAGSIVASTKFFRMFMQTAILGTGAYLAINREISPGSMIAASILIGRAMQPIELAVSNWKGFVAARGAYGRLKALFDLVGHEPDRLSLPRPIGRLAVQGLAAAAPGGKSAILRDVTFALDSGDVLGIVGPSAAGKSSLARVLVGVWPAVAGAVRLDGSELQHWNSHELGRHVGYLPQDVELFSGTIAENIARFQDIDEAEILEATQLAGCHELVQGLADGYNTQIGDGGQALSGGQRQRIGLARALYGNPSFIVLDEPNASLDTAGETALLSAIQQMKQRGCTVVIITHKMNILAIADKILVMNKGTVQAFGPRDPVLAQLSGPRVVPTSALPRAVAGATGG